MTIINEYKNKKLITKTYIRKIKNLGGIPRNIKNLKNYKNLKHLTS